MKLKDKVTLVVNTCDAYSDLWAMYFAALNEFWPNRSINVVLNTEYKKDLGFQGTEVLIHNSVSKYWGERLLNTLSDIKTEYVFMVYDDFIIEEVFDETVLINVIDWMEKDNLISVFYLDTLDLKADKPSTSYEGFSLIQSKSDYRLNSAPGIWRKCDLELFTGEQDSPWAWEVFGTYKTQKEVRSFYQATTKKFYSFNGSQGGAIYRGKWVRDVVIEKNKKYNLDIDFSKRGFSSDSEFEKRPLSWKLEFLWTGYKMVGLDVIQFICRAIVLKISRFFNKSSKG